MEKDFVLPTLIALGLLLLVSAFFSGVETAMMALNRVRLRHLVDKKVRNAATVSKLIANLEKLLASVLIGNNIVNVAISILAGMLFVKYFGERWGVVVGTFAVAFVLLVFGELMPKTFAAQRPDPVALFFAQPMRFVTFILAPLSRVLNFIAKSFMRVFVWHPIKKAPIITEEELKLMIEIGKEEGILGDEERKMLHRIFEFGDAKVADVMVPAKDIVSVDINIEQDKLLEIITEEGYSRLPVYEKNQGNIIGVIFARELLHLWRDNVLIIVKDIIHPVYYAKKDHKVIDLLRDFKKMHLHMAIVTNDKGAAIGLVTLQDLIDEIVGETMQEQRGQMPE